MIPRAQFTRSIGHGSPHDGAFERDLRAPVGRTIPASAAFLPFRWTIYLPLVVTGTAQSERQIVGLDAIPLLRGNAPAATAIGRYRIGPLAGDGAPPPGPNGMRILGSIWR